jgi:uncharacterized protein (TIGR03000 family)
MQWNWLSRTKLLLAGLALVVVMGDSMAGPFANRRNNRQQGQWMPADQGSTTTVQQPQPQPMPAVAQPVAGQPAGEQPAAGQPAAQAAPMPSATPTVQSSQPVYQDNVGNGRRGLFGRRGGRNNGGSFSYAPSMTGTTQPGTIQPGSTRQSFYPANGQSALIDIRVPVANAQITFDGAPTVQQGINRVFSTPALNPQAANTYEVKARWTGNDGNAVEQTRTVKALPGGRIVVDFTTQQQ